MILLSILILTFPMDFELYRERKGEAPAHKRKSTKIRALLMIVCALIAAWIRGLTWLMYLKCLLLSFAIFFLVFDYAINLILGRKPWYSYLSDSPLDRLASKVDWRIRMAVRTIIFTASLIWFLI